MQYFVIDANGNRQGPFELEALNAQAREGSLKPNSLLQHADSGDRMAASSVQGLVFAPAAPSGLHQPYGSMGFGQPPSAYNPQPYVEDKAWGQFALALGLAIISPVLSIYIIFGLATAIWGMEVSWRVIQHRNSLGWLTMILNFACLGFWVYWRFIR